MNSTRLLPDWITAYMGYAENSEPPDSYKKWTAMAIISACLQRKCHLQWGLTLYPNLYIVLVGPSGARKGTAIKKGRPLLEDMSGISISPEAVTREQLIRRLRSSNMEMMGGNSHASMTIFSEELTVFLGYGNLQLMADLCDWFDCSNEWKYETKNSGSDHIRNLWVSLLGATTPTLLQSTMPTDAIGGGLTSRIIFVFEPKKGKTIARPFITPKEVELETMLSHDLAEIQCMSGEFIPDDSFLARWDVWYPMQDNKPIFSDPRLEGYLTRRGIHVLKIAMVINASRGGNMTLTEEDFNRALEEITAVEVNMPRVFRGIGTSTESAVIDRIMTSIAIKGTMKVSEILGMYYQDADRDTIMKIIGLLTTMEIEGKKHYQWLNNDPTTKTVQYVGGDNR